MILRAPYRADSQHSVTDGTRRFPVVDGIAFLRSGREALSDAALAELDAGKPERALELLLADRDDWATGPGPQPDDLRMLARGPVVSLRAAMALLAYGPVADYFAYRWSDPTFLSGLALLGCGLPRAPGLVVEVACGVGHYLRELGARAIPAVGVDVVFSKLWLARRYVAPDAVLVCADAASGLPLATHAASAVLCHDAFYFFTEKQKIFDEMRRISSGPVLLGHLHNRDIDTVSSGAPLSVAEYVALLGPATLFDDGELTNSFLGRRAPASCAESDLESVAALSAVVDGPSFATWDFSRPIGELRTNPLFFEDGPSSEGPCTLPRWPSQRYATEYASASTYLRRTAVDRTSAPGWSPDLDDLTRRRVLLALPAQW